MRPLFLSLEGFMAFRDKETLDFTKQNIFVLTGPTGSGKSSILDAISFALYGETPRLGSKDLKKVIYQDVENPAQKARVIFAFRHLGRDYRMTRQVTLSGHRAELDSRESPEDEWSSYVTGSVTEIKKLIPQLLGLNFDAFRRVLMLPQGGFDQFLKQDGAGERRQLLMNLAQLGVYKKIQAAADVQRVSLGSRSDTIKGELTGIGAVSAEELVTMEDRLEGISAQSQLDQDLFISYENTLKNAESLWEALAEAKELQTATEKHRIAGESLSQKEQQVNEGELLLRLMPDLGYLEKHLQKVRNLNQIKDQLSHEQTLLQKQQEALQHERDILKENEQRLPEWEAQLETLKDLGALVARYDDLTTQYKQTQQRLKSQKQEQTQIEQELQQAQQAENLAQEKSLTLAEHLDSVSFSAERLALLYEVGVLMRRLEDELKPRFARAQEAFTQWKQNTENLQQELQKKQQDFDRAKAAREKAQSHVDTCEVNLEKARQQAIAQDLRAHLHVGDSCPVCEQTVNTAPASKTSDTETACLQDSLKTAKKQLRDRDAEQQEAFQALSQTQSKQQHHLEQEQKIITDRKLAHKDASTIAQECRDRLEQKDLPTLSEIREDYASESKRGKKREQLELEQKALEKEVQACGIIKTKAHAALSEKEKTIDVLKEQAQKERDQGQQVAQELQSALGVKANYSEVRQERLQALQSQIKEHHAHAQNIQTRTASSEKQAEVNQSRQHNNQEQLDALNEDIARLKNTLNTEMVKLGYSDYKELRNAAPEPEDITRWRTEINEHAASGIALHKDLDKAQRFIAGRHLTEETLLQYRTQHQQLKADMDYRRTETAVLREKITLAQDRQQRAKTLNEELNHVQSQLALYERIYHDLSSRQLPDFLAKRILERVMQEGSEELSILSNGRYSFELDDKEELVILDAWNAMEPRSVKTLSGGESFLASLSLALALNKYLSNGIQLDSLFIDEGFGTLDAESLELAASVVEKLQLSGKCVGVITHIAELAERFEARIEVIKSETGAKLRPV